MRNYIVREVGYEALMAAIIEQAMLDAEKADDKAYDAYIDSWDASDVHDHDAFVKAIKEEEKWNAEKADAEQGIEEWRKLLEDLLLPTVY